MKGFTLIELLAVIVILAIIILISVPLISNVIESTKKSALESSAKMLVDAAENAYAINKMNNENEEVTYTFTGGVQSVSPIGKDLLQFSGKAPEDGYLRLNINGEIELAFTDGEYYISKSVGSDFSSVESYTNQKIMYIKPFECGDSFTDSRDSNVYTTVQIGSQCWMAKNLAYLPSVVQGSTYSNVLPYNYVYGFNGTDVAAAKETANYINYGVLYNWTSAMNGSTVEGSQGICPTGWHIPSDNEWKTLEKSLGMTQIQADGTGYRGTNQGTQLVTTSGFGLLFGGQRVGTTYSDVTTIGMYWTSTSATVANSWQRYVFHSRADVDRSTMEKDRGFSVRCVID